MPVLIIVVIAHIMLIDTGMLFAPVLHCLLPIASTMCTSAPTTQDTDITNVSIVLPYLAYSRLQHVRLPFGWVNHLLAMNVKLGCAKLVDPHHHSCFLLEGLVKELLCRTADAVLDLPKDVLFGSITKEEHSMLVTGSRLAQPVDLTVQVLPVY